MKYQNYSGNNRQVEIKDLYKTEWHRVIRMYLYLEVVKVKKPNDLDSWQIAQFTEEKSIWDIN